MKKFTLICLLVFGSFAANAQDLTWYDNIDKAMEVSKKSKKPLMLFFTGSDWCGWCIRLQKEVFKTPEFAQWAKDNVVLVELDFPRRKQLAPAIAQQNMELQRSFGIQGYPTVWFANASKKDGNTNFDQLGRTGYVAGGPTAWLASANQILGKK